MSVFLLSVCSFSFCVPENKRSLSVLFVFAWYKSVKQCGYELLPLNLVMQTVPFKLTLGRSKRQLVTNGDGPELLVCVCWMLIPGLKVNRGHDLKPSMDTVWDLLQQNWLLVCCCHRWSVCMLKCPPQISSSRRCAYGQWESALYRRNPINFVCSAWIIQVIVRKSSKRKENKPYSFFSCLPNRDKAKVFQSKPRWHYF